MDPRRGIPRTDDLLRLPEVSAAAQTLGRDRVKAVVTAVTDQARQGQLPPEQVMETVIRAVSQPIPATQLQDLLNATGVVLHTNAGRASLSGAAREAVAAAAGYVDVELDLTTGRRTSRGRHTLAALAALVPAAEAVMAVNNGAAALVLATTALTGGEQNEILVSRGEMVEIGDGFRLPELIESTGARLREVGTTNRTKLSDYTVGPRTTAILKVHPSNFRVEGFTSAVGVKELAGLGVPVIADVGSGLLQPHPLLPDEPDVTAALQDGAAVVTASGDKLFGGPQAGLIFGRDDVMQRLRRHPLARAVRLDKLTLAALEATAARGHSPTGPTRDLPTWQALLTSPEDLRTRTETLAAQVVSRGIPADVVGNDGRVGGGGAPGVDLPGWAVGLPEELSEPLRTGQPPVLTRVSGGRTLIDLRCVPPERDPEFAAAVVKAAGR